MSDEDGVGTTECEDEDVARRAGKGFWARDSSHQRLSLTLFVNHAASDFVALTFVWKPTQSTGRRASPATSPWTTKPGHHIFTL